MAELYFGWLNTRHWGPRAFDAPLRRNPYPDGTLDHELWWASLIERPKDDDLALG